MLEVESWKIPPSKSLFNRALVLKSFEPELKILTNSSFLSEDVTLLKEALEDFSEGKKEFYVGAGAAPLKFLALRLSRQAGRYSIRGTERLFSRPVGELINVLKSLGCEGVEVGKDTLSFSSPSQWPTQILVDASTSSQVISALALSSWDLDENLEVTLQGSEIASRSYLEMTLNLMMGAAWTGELKKNADASHTLLLPKKQFIVLDEVFIEPDMSCVAAISLAALLKDGIKLKGMIPSSMQGDAVIFSMLENMGYSIETKKDKSVDAEDVFYNLPLAVEMTIPALPQHSGLSCNLLSTPDLFPVLAAFVATATKESDFMGLKNLNSKESRRLDRMAELLTTLGVKCEKIEGEFKVFPSKLSDKTFDFDPDQDHRIAMAAALLNLQGAKINILHKEVVNKSFPNFWQLLGPPD